ncbi:MAG: hypothetical protein AAGB24_15385 [Bacteroidota bacterium]
MNNARNWTILGIILLVLTGCVKKHTTIDRYIGFDITKDEIDGHLQKRINELNITGMSIA